MDFIVVQNNLFLPFDTVKDLKLYHVVYLPQYVLKTMRLLSIAALADSYDLFIPFHVYMNSLLVQIGIR